jgi:hypothetical protein
VTSTGHRWRTYCDTSVTPATRPSR